MYCDIYNMKCGYKIRIRDGYRIKCDDNRKQYIILCDRVVMYGVLDEQYNGRYSNIK